MRITVVSRSWPSNERSGVTLAAAQHVRALAENGHEVSIVGAFSNVLDEHLPVVSRFHVPARGGGALYSPIHIDRALLTDVFRRSSPALVVVESWQTALTDVAVDIAFELGLPILMVSHGVSLHPFTNHPVDILRGLAWTYYRLKTLPRRISSLSAITTLDESATSFRFYDRDLALQLGIPVLPLVNAPVNWMATSSRREQRKPQILVIGYYSPVKNQIGALHVLAGLPVELQLRFIGPRNGRYYERCRALAVSLGLESRVSFLEDNECDLSVEISHSLVVLSTSTTEVLPIVLLEAMASSTPFVATPVGAVPSLRAGIVAADSQSQCAAVSALAGDTSLWNQVVREGQCQYQARFTLERVHESLLHAVEVALQQGPAETRR